MPSQVFVFNQSCFSATKPISKVIDQKMMTSNKLVAKTGDRKKLIYKKVMQQILYFWGPQSLVLATPLG